MRHGFPIHREFFGEAAAGLGVVGGAVGGEDDALFAADALGFAAVLGDRFRLEPEEPEFVGPFLDQRAGLLAKLQLIAVVSGEDVRRLGALDLAVGKDDDMFAGVDEGIQAGQEAADFFRCHDPALAETEILDALLFARGEEVFHR